MTPTNISSPIPCSTLRAYLCNGQSRCAMGSPTNPSAAGPAPGVGPAWLDGASVGSGAIGTGSMSGLLQLSALVLWVEYSSCVLVISIYSLVAFKKNENISDLHRNISKYIVVSNRNVASKIYQPSKRNLHYGQPRWPTTSCVRKRQRST